MHKIVFQRTVAAMGQSVCCDSFLIKRSTFDCHICVQKHAHLYTHIHASLL